MGTPGRYISVSQRPIGGIKSRQFPGIHVQPRRGQYPAAIGKKHIAEHRQRDYEQDKKRMAPVKGIPEEMIKRFAVWIGRRLVIYHEQIILWGRGKNPGRVDGFSFRLSRCMDQ